MSRVLSFFRITNSPIADVFVVWAKTEDGQVRGFLLEKVNLCTIHTTHPQAGETQLHTNYITFTLSWCGKKP